MTSLLRKRLFQGITLAIYGLGVVDLHYWGFGIPFLIAGAWYLVRATPEQALSGPRGRQDPARTRPQPAPERGMATLEQALHEVD